VTLTASGPISRDGVDSGFNRTVNTAADVRELVELLAQDEVGSAMIDCASATMDAHVTSGFGYLQYAGPGTLAMSVGDPDSPAVDSEEGFPTGSGVPVAALTDALIQFLTDEKLPTAVTWRDL
jgi:hypothetical protein